MNTRTLLKPGYKAFNGYVFDQSDCDRYNQIQARINSFIAAGMPVPAIEKDYSHKTFCWITRILN